MRAVRRQRNWFDWIGWNFVVVPGAILLILSLPRLIASLRYGGWADEFLLRHLFLTGCVAFLLSTGRVLARSYFKRTGPIIIASVIVTTFLLRLIDVELKNRFGISFSPRVFAHLSPSALEMALIEYPWVPPLLLVSIVVLYMRHKFTADAPELRLPRLVVVMLVVANLVAFAGLCWKWNLRALPTAHLLDELYRYYGDQEILERVSWSPQELRVARELGFDFSLPSSGEDALSIAGPNLIIVYLEGFNADYTHAGGGPYQGLTPNIDAFAQENTFVGNYFSGVDDTINALVSSWCGLLTQFRDYSWEHGDVLSFASGVPCLSDILKSRGYRTVLITGVKKEFAGTSAFADHHQVDDMIGRDEIIATKKNFARSPSAAVYDVDLVEYAINTISSLDRERPFFLSLFTMDSHFPFTHAPECPPYENAAGIPEWDETTRPMWRKPTAWLRAVRCTDHAVGRLLDVLRDEGYFEDSVIIVVGDHANWRDLDRAKRLFLAFHSPLFNRHEPLNTYSYTPDIAPTALELLGFESPVMYAGRSILSSRSQYQHLVAPGFDLYEGNVHFEREVEGGSSSGSLNLECESPQVLRTRLTSAEKPFTACERRKLLLLQDQWLLERYREAQTNRSGP